MSNPYTSPSFDAGLADDTPRSGCLTTYLVLMLIANPLVALAYLLLVAVGGGKDVAPVPALLLLAALSLANTGAAVAIWMRIKLGLYAFFGTAALGLLINLSMGQFQGLLGAIVGPAILWALVSKEWHTYR